MRRALALCLLLGGCFADAPPVDDVVAEDSSSEAGESDGDEESSSSGDVPADPLDAYGPCQIDADCELVPGDEGQVGDSVRCVEGTCAIRCADAGPASCPGYFTTQAHEFQPTIYPIVCGDDGYCTITRDPSNPGPGSCPDGMGKSETETVPDLDCVWEP